MWNGNSFSQSYIRSTVLCYAEQGGLAQIMTESDSRTEGGVGGVGRPRVRLPVQQSPS